MDTENWDEGFEIESEPQAGEAGGQPAPNQWTNGPAASMFDHAIDFGSNLDWATPMISLINFTVGTHVGYGIYTNFVSTKYVMAIPDLKRIFDKRGIDYCSTMIMGVGAEEKYMFDVPVDQKEYTEAVMNKFGVLWFGGYQGWGEWAMAQITGQQKSGYNHQVNGDDDLAFAF